MDNRLASLPPWVFTASGQAFPVGNGVGTMRVALSQLNQRVGDLTGNIARITADFERAEAAGADPVAFRLAHLDDPRAKAVIEAAAARFGWGRALPAGRGAGFAFARYKNLAAYCALAVEVEVARESGRVRLVRAQAAVDAGQVVNPHGIRDQIEGGIIQATSWSLFEAVQHDADGPTSLDWSTYPIVRFPDVPERLDVHLIDRPGSPFLGAGEVAQGPTAAALASAIRQAVGVRLRELPMRPELVKAAIGV